MLVTVGYLQVYLQDFSIVYRVALAKLGPSLASLHKRIFTSERAWKKSVFIEKEMYLTKVYFFIFFSSPKHLLKTLGSRMFNRS